MQSYNFGPTWPEVERKNIMPINPNSDAALEVSDQAEYNRSITEAMPLKLDVSVRPIEPKGNLVGFASLKFNDSFVIDDFKVLESDKGLFVGMPSKPDKNSKSGYRDTARPITKEFRALLTEAVTNGYREAVERLQSRAANLTAEKSSMKEQLADGAKQAAEQNAARPDPAKGRKAKSAEI